MELFFATHELHVLCYNNSAQKVSTSFILFFFPKPHSVRRTHKEPQQETHEPSTSGNTQPLPSTAQHHVDLGRLQKGLLTKAEMEALIKPLENKEVAHISPAELNHLLLVCYRTFLRVGQLFAQSEIFLRLVKLRPKVTTRSNTYTNPMHTPHLFRSKVVQVPTVQLWLHCWLTLRTLKRLVWSTYAWNENSMYHLHHFYHLFLFNLCLSFFS